MKRFLTWCCTLVMALQLTACGGEEDGGQQQLEELPIKSIQVTPAQQAIPLGMEQQFIAQAKMVDGSVQDVTDLVEWSSSDPEMVIIDNTAAAKGLAKGLALGAVTITAKANGGSVTGTSQEITVSDAVVDRIEITPKPAAVPMRFSIYLTATAIFTDGTTMDVTNDGTVNWTSSNPTIATISNVAGTKGRATGIMPGVVTITAAGTANGKDFSKATELTVTTAVMKALAVSPKTGSVPMGMGMQFTAEASMSDGSVLDITRDPIVSWVSEKPEIAMVSNGADKGWAKGLSEGSATIKASCYADGKPYYGQATLTVTGLILTGLQVTPEKVELPVGFEQQFTATALYSDGSTQEVTDDTVLSWTSTDPAIATVNGLGGGKGVATGVSAGSTSIMVSGVVNGTAVSGLAEVTVNVASVTAIQVTPATAAVSVGLTRQFTAEAQFSDGNVLDVTNDAALSWASNNTAVASISNAAGSKGLATGEGEGGATITASLAGTTSGSAALTVIDARATELLVMPKTATVPVGQEHQFTAMVLLSDGSSLEVTDYDTLSWTSSDPAIAHISNVEGSKGLATGVKVGNVTITATGDVSGQPFSGSAVLTVTNAVVTGLKLTPTAAGVSAGLTQQFTAIAEVSDGSTLDVTTSAGLTWSSSAPNIATISNDTGSKGLATGVSAGEVIITASLADAAGGPAITKTAELLVSSAVMTGLQLTPALSAIPVSLEQQFRATAIFSDGTSTDVTNYPDLVWSSSNTGIATISNADGLRGLATGVSAGTTSITATGTLNGSTVTSLPANLTVTNDTVTALQVTPAVASVSVGKKQQFTAIAQLSGGGVLEVTTNSALTWHSDNVVAAISNTLGSKGEATGLTEGITGIVASLSGQTSNTATLSVVAVSTPPVVIESTQNQLALLTLSPSEFEFWNSTSINSVEGQEALKDLTSSVYNQFRDEFDFITVVVNNDAVPTGMPTGEYTHVKNDVTGIGLEMFDKTAEFHSDGKLQGISFLYKKQYLSTSLYGPILHEMAHRWANWVVPTSSPGHWGQELGITGQLNSVSANYADIELYLMGLMDSAEMTDPASIDAYNLIPTDQRTRVPNAASSQKQFRVLLLILSETPLTATEIQDYNNGATLLTRTDNPAQGTNFHRMTRGRGVMVVSGLDGLTK